MRSPLHTSGAPRALLALFGALALVTACTKPPARPPQAPITVAIAVAKRADVPYIVESNGIVTPIQAANVSPQVSGMITRVAFSEGQEVQKGQLLFQIDPRPYENAYQQAAAAYSRDSASAASATDQVNRYQKLVATGVITPEEALQYATTAATTAAVVRSDAAAVSTAKFDLDNTSIRAPISGKTGSLLVRQGNLVTAGVGPLVVINQTRPITIRFSVPASELATLLRYSPHGGLPVTAVPGGGSAGLTPLDSTQGSSASEGSPLAEAMAAQQANGSQPEQGTLSFIDNAVDTTTGTLQLKATFPNTSGDLWVGQFAAMKMRLYVEQQALVIPAQAVVNGQKGTYVYTLDANSKAHQHLVVVERTADNLAVISAGVSEGDRVVTEGQSRLTDGAQATLRGAGDAAAAAAGTTSGGGAGRKGGGRGAGGSADGKR